jgi:hypothetical protein
MLISAGRGKPEGPWNILEVAVGQAPDILALRISRQLKKLREPIEALVPMRRTPDGDAEWIVEHVYIHGATGSLRTIAQTPGIDFIRPEEADSQWIQRLLSAEQLCLAQSLQVGSFVRVLVGPCARLCGHVTSLSATQATVTIRLFTKKVSAHVHRSNLQAIQCLPDQQVFYYQPSLFC